MNVGESPRSCYGTCFGIEDRFGEQRIDVVVVGYHGGSWLEACLASRLAEILVDARVLLVDNDGDNGLDRLPLGELSVEVVSTPEPMGFAEANNFGLGFVRPGAGAVCFLNQDTISEPGWLDACSEVLRERPEVGAVSPLLRTYDGSGWDPGFLACARVSERFDASDAAGRSMPEFIEVPEVTAAAMVVRGDVLRQVGPFDPIFGSYYEDYDLCRRIREAGYKVGIATRGTVRHFSGSATRSPAAERRRKRLILRNRAIHRIRSAGDDRLSATLRTLGPTFGYNLGRGVMGTSSSQPPSVQLAAQMDLLKLFPRLVSRSRDESLWRRYLDELGWPPRSNETNSSIA